MKPTCLWSRCSSPSMQLVVGINLRVSSFDSCAYDVQDVRKHQSQSKNGVKNALVLYGCSRACLCHVVVFKHWRKQRGAYIRIGTIDRTKRFFFFPSIHLVVLNRFHRFVRVRSICWGKIPNIFAVDWDSTSTILYYLLLINMFFITSINISRMVWNRWYCPQRAFLPVRDNAAIFIFIKLATRCYLFFWASVVKVISDRYGIIETVILWMRMTIGSTIGSTILDELPLTETMQHIYICEQF